MRPATLNSKYSEADVGNNESEKIALCFLVTDNSEHVMY
jgi:hypothetical protein